MPTQNLRKHVIPSGADKSFNRATIFESFGNSIHDVVPVANTTERSQLVTAMTNKGVGPSATNPLVVQRGDAPGLHRIEYTTDGTVWIPASGDLDFPTQDAADAWGATNGGLLRTNDRATVNGKTITWLGSRWSKADGELITTFSDGWAATVGYDYRPKLFADGNRRMLTGLANCVSGSLSSILTIPAEHRPNLNQFLGGHSNSAGQHFELFLNSSGLLQVPAGYGTASVFAGYPVTSWWIKN